MNSFDIGLMGLSLTQADSHVFLKAQPTEGRQPIDVAALHALLVREGYGDCQFREEAIAKAVSDCNNQTEPLVILLADQIDATIKVNIAPDEMTAVLNMTAAHGGKAAAMADVLKALGDAGVVFGIDEEALIRACELGDCTNVPVAIGSPAQDGEDARLDELIPQAADRAPKLDENGLIDYREHGHIPVVQVGAPLMRRIPATSGLPGHTILGHVLPPHPGQDKTFAAQLPGAQVASEDPNLLQAAVTGQPVRVDGGVMVEPILRVAEVNMASGNIHFDGTVEVNGEVVQGMKVQASGDILVNGMVDGGLLEAGGNIQVQGGVIAHAKLKAGGSVTVRFAQGAKISAGTVIMINDMALECELESLNQIVVGAQAPERGRLIGGVVTAMMLVRTPLLGSAKGTTTTIRLGANRELQGKYTTLLERIAKEKATEENLQKIVKQLTSLGDPKGMLERVKASWRHAVQVWGKSLAEKSELEEQIARGMTARLEVGVAVGGAVDLSIGNLAAKLRREFNAGSFLVDSEGVIIFTDLQGQVEPVAK